VLAQGVSNVHLKFMVIKKIARIIVTLQDTEPVIWRKLLVRTDTTFYKLHRILQVAMGWTNSHLFEFNLEGFRLGELVDEDDPFEDDYGPSKVLDARKTTLQELLSGQGDQCQYIYDFGDHWVHLIELETFEDEIPDTKYPVCLDGERRCPPEDCGGVHGFSELLNVLNDKKRPEYADYKRWLPRNYKPEILDLSAVNKKLLKFAR